MEEIIEQRDLVLDKKNSRKHNQKNLTVIKKSLDSCGAGRSILIDEENNVLAGNGVMTANGGRLKVRVVESDGSEIIAVKRTNLTEEQKERLKLFDNYAGDLSKWNWDELKILSDSDNNLIQDVFENDSRILGRLSELKEVEIFDELEEENADEQPAYVLKEGQEWKVNTIKIRGYSDFEMLKKLFSLLSDLRIGYKLLNADEQAEEYVSKHEPVNID
ncbi:MAG: hypothetical protein KGZ97_09740 [Bacteroidetes bacterium]|nr:hypothetical protein [Bacteroidota bacterium]